MRAGLVALDQRVVVGQEVEALGAGAAAGLHRRADRADVVAQVRRAGGGDAGEDSGWAGHAVMRLAQQGSEGGEQEIRASSSRARSAGAASRC